MVIVNWFVAWLLTLMLASYIMSGHSLKFLRETWGFILLIDDFAPNIGLFWYYFLEAFAIYRKFYLCAFHIHTFCYVIPLAIRLR